MLDTALAQRLGHIEQLPTIPPLVAESLRLLGNAEVSAAQVAYLIERDQALTARLLRVANSPVYGFPRRITTVRLAISLLGNDAVRQILVAVALYELVTVKRGAEWERELFWRYCLYCATAARFLARHIGYRLAGEAFTAGLLHDLGISLLATYLPGEFTAIVRHQQHTGCSRVEAERLFLRATHADVGAWLAEKWNLPPVLVAALAYHHTPDPPLLPDLSAHRLPAPLDTVQQPLTALTATAEYLAHWAGLRRWSGEDGLQSPLYLPEPLWETYLAHRLIDQTGEPTPELREGIEQEYRLLAEVLH